MRERKTHTKERQVSHSSIIKSRKKKNGGPKQSRSLFHLKTSVKTVDWKGFDGYLTVVDLITGQKWAILGSQLSGDLTTEMNYSKICIQIQGKDINKYGL